jgi:hypothetical protein
VLPQDTTAYQNRELKKMITIREFSLAVIVIGFGYGVLYKATEPRRQMQQRLTCYSNLKQIGLSVMQYVQDNDQTYPRSSFGSQATLPAGYSYTWMDANLAVRQKHTNI